MTISRLDDRNVTDPILRAYMRQEIMTKAMSYDSDLLTYDILADEIYRPELIAYRIWGTGELRWVVTLVCGLEDECDAMEEGTEITVPTLAWIREQINTFSATSPEIPGSLYAS
ncbi:baseplate protein [Chimaeribacter californicus]|uniref:Baseplate protein n=1 Tax=Chimaeribacter californicus TaxID=2060067 RepID=A0A2N5DTR9_9GAMM|nr:baseplate protein [Chimaeribacter californicus]PLR30021.1 baseplate protein [Chimaeribacter californicus]